MIEWARQLKVRKEAEEIIYRIQEIKSKEEKLKIVDDIKDLDVAKEILKGIV